MKLVVVKFTDCTTFGHWASIEEADASEAKLCLAAGWLLGSTKEYVKVALLLSQDKLEVNSWVVIPAGQVVSVDKIREVDWEDA